MRIFSIFRSLKLIYQNSIFTKFIMKLVFNIAQTSIKFGATKVLINTQCINNHSTVVGWRWISETLCKVEVASKQVYGDCLGFAAQLIQYSFDQSRQNTVEKYYHEINKIHWKLQHMYSLLVSRKGPILCTTMLNYPMFNQCSRSWMNWATKLPHPAYSPDFSLTN